MVFSACDCRGINWENVGLGMRPRRGEVEYGIFEMFIFSFERARKGRQMKMGVREVPGMLSVPRPFF